MSVIVRVVCVFAIGWSLGACAGRPERSARAIAVDPHEQSCARWTAEVCRRAGAGDTDLCEAARTSAEVLTGAACAIALAAAPRIDTALSTRKQRCRELEARLCRDLGERSRNCRFVRESTPKLAPERCTRMLAGYGDVLADLERRSDAYRLSEVQAAKLIAGDPPALGPADAPIQLVEFLDFENAYASQAAAIVRELRAKYGARLRVVVRQFPLPEDAHAELAAEAAFAAHAQGKFAELYEQLFAHPRELDRTALLRHASAIGLDTCTFQRALDRHTYRAAVDADRALVSELRIAGMPTMYVNAERMLNAVDRESIVDAIDDALAVSERRRATAGSSRTSP